jgi:hypothetical protein
MVGSFLANSKQVPARQAIDVSALASTNTWTFATRACITATNSGVFPHLRIVIPSGQYKQDTKRWAHGRTGGEMDRNPVSEADSQQREFHIMRRAFWWQGRAHRRSSNRSRDSHSGTQERETTHKTLARSLAHTHTLTRSHSVTRARTNDTYIHTRCTRTRTPSLTHSPKHAGVPTGTYILTRSLSLSLTHTHTHTHTVTHSLSQIDKKNSNMTGKQIHTRG